LPFSSTTFQTSASAAWLMAQVSHRPSSASNHRLGFSRNNNANSFLTTHLQLIFHREADHF